jgi:SNF2 family DNA or RNA helicase
MTEPTIAPGANILVRDAAWRVTRVDRTSSGGRAIRAVGLSELVRDKETLFLEDYEEQFGREIQVLDPRTTELVRDDSSNFQKSLLFLESQLREMPPTDEKLYVGPEAAMDLLPFQLEPAAQALRQPRQRILIADAVGLGKTLEAGILLSELIARGRAKRILVVAVKSMLTQFQKEMWSRFTIPLVRLDSVGLQRIRQRIPTNQNPFYHYDRTIISVDTLKQNNEYRTFLEDAHWDVIVIDEAHNVAVRGKRKSQRAKLAELLSHRSDTLIMLSATPHDGKARSFASLMNMLDPTAIADPDDYTKEDIDGLFVRRFKKDISDQVADSFPDREIYRASAEATGVEEEAFQVFTDLEFRTLDQGRSGGHMLFKTALEKALFSSPAACISTIHNRIKKLEKKLEDDSGSESAISEDIASLRFLKTKLESISPDCYAKYQKLLDLFENDENFGFTGWARDDRMVIFTERIDTMEWLAEHLPRDLDLDEKKVATLHGGMSDIDQQHVVEEFGKEKADVRLLIASDVASEGINLHYYCHRMVHFDVPWSLLVFQQRNGRIDRYGQTETPYIAYMITESDNEDISGDTRILELLIDKDEQASANIGDPSALMGVYDIDEQEQQTAQAMESKEGADAFEQQLQDTDLLSQMLAAAEQDREKDDKRRPQTDSLPSLFKSDFDYLRDALSYLRQDQQLEFEADPERQRIELVMPDNLDRRFDKLPDEVYPEHGRAILTGEADKMQDAIRDARAEETAWPVVQYLWRLNPIVDWANDRMAGNFGRHTAPVIQVAKGLAEDETIFLVSGLIPNRKSQPLIHRWFGAKFRGGEFDDLLDFDTLRERLGLGDTKFPNRQEDFDDERLEDMLPDAVEMVTAKMGELRADFEDSINPRLNEELARLDTLKNRQLEHQQQLLDDGAISHDQLDREKRSIERIFDEYYEWVEDTMTTEQAPFVQVMSVFAPYGAG